MNICVPQEVYIQLQGTSILGKYSCKMFWAFFDNIMVGSHKQGNAGRKKEEQCLPTRKTKIIQKVQNAKCTITWNPSHIIL